MGAAFSIDSYIKSFMALFVVKSTLAISFIRTGITKG